MFSLIKGIIWIVGFVVVAHYVLAYFGYEINKNYFLESRAKCEERAKECAGNVIYDGVKNAKCDFNCLDPKLIIKKK